LFYQIAPYDKFTPTTIKNKYCSMKFQKMNSQFIVKPYEHSSKFETKWKLHLIVFSPLLVEPINKTLFYWAFVIVQIFL
jgi:hypothetical protein